MGAWGVEELWVSVARSPWQAIPLRVLAQPAGDVCRSLGIDVPGVEHGDTAGLPRWLWDKQPSYLRPCPPSVASRGPVPWAPVTAVSGLSRCLQSVQEERHSPSAEGTRGTRTLCRSIVWSPGLGHVRSRRRERHAWQNHFQGEDWTPSPSGPRRRGFFKLNSTF